MTRRFKPTLGDIKVAAIIVHVQEFLSPDGCDTDKQAILPLLNDPDVAEWLQRFDQVWLPVKRVQR